jgi:hypothetical protein
VRTTIRSRTGTASVSAAAWATRVASSLINVGQQVGGSIGLAILGTVAWSAAASSLRSRAAAAAKAGLDV